MDLSTCTPDDLIHFGQTLYTTYLPPALGSFEQAAQVCASTVYKKMLWQGLPCFPLVRVFRVGHYEEIADELKPLLRVPGEHWITLMGTMGDEAAWCDRRSSRHHQVMPAHADYISPMMNELFRQVELRVGVKADAQNPVHKWWAGTHYFHIAQVPGNLLIPDQQQFVQPYGIESLIGVATSFLSGAAAMLICFSRIPMSQEIALKFAEIAPFIATLLANYDTPDTLWQQDK